MFNIIDDGDEAIVRRLVAAVLLQAARDVQADRPCNTACRPVDRVHFCRRDAQQFLNSSWGRLLLEVVGLDHWASRWDPEWQADATTTAVGHQMVHGGRRSNPGNTPERGMNRNHSGPVSSWVRGQK